MNEQPAVREHKYDVRVQWSGAAHGPTSSYAGYSREHEILIAGKVAVAASADSTFRGDAAAHNPEELLVASLASCHMLSYLALCGREKLAVTAYEDRAAGTMSERGGVGRFISVVLHPHVTIDDARVERARELHHLAHEACFIANSVNFPVSCEATIVRAT